jgi:hypothetical protein
MPEYRERIVPDNVDKGVQVTRDVEELQTENYILRQKLTERDNGIKWMRSVAFSHWFGGAFEPRHMYSLMILASRILNEEILPDFEKSNSLAKQQGHELWENIKDAFE